MFCRSKIARHSVRCAWATVLATFSSSIAFSAEPTADQIAFFETEIRPILAETCYECHGPDKEESGLRLDSKAGFHAGGESGSLLNPENLSASRLIHVIEYDGEIKMPEDLKLVSTCSRRRTGAWRDPGARRGSPGGRSRTGCGRAVAASCRAARRRRTP